MRGNIKHNNVRHLGLTLLKDEYWDFMLFKGEAFGGYEGLTTKCLSSFIDINNDDCFGDNGYLYSTTTWEEAINSGVALTHIGYTGIDNGLIEFNKEDITPNCFWKIFKGTKYRIPKNDMRFFMHPVTGNTGLYSYESSIEEENGKRFLSLKGGFYQGFFKLEGYDYQSLPHIIEDEWNFEFVIRKRGDYQLKENIINNIHPDNNGIFFYIGTRAENKFAEIYNGIYDNETSVKNEPRLYQDNLISEEDLKEKLKNNKCDEIDEQVDLSKIDLEINKTSFIEFDTDNKYLFFNHTKTGYTTVTFSELMNAVEKYDLTITENDILNLTNFNTGENVLYIENGILNVIGLTLNEDGILVPLTDTPEENEVETIHISMEARNYIDNPYNLYNRTETGYTIENYYDITKPINNVWSSANTYNMTKDIMGQAFALKLTDDGAISYFYTVKDCDSDTGYTTLTEKTLTGLVKENEWNIINVKFSVLEGYVCNIPQPKDRKMKMYIYLNGYLVFISKEIPAFYFKPLNDTYDKQEGVPYNISLGGGTQGLMECIWPNYFKTPIEVYELEKKYAGTFIGDIMSFKFYTCGLNIQEIRENYKFVVNKLDIKHSNNYII